MAKKKAAKELKEVFRKELANGTVVIKYEDGSVVIIPAPLKLTSDEIVDIFGEEEDDEDPESEDDEEEDEDEDSEDEEDEDSDDEDSDEDEDSEEDEDEDGDDEDDEELTGEALAEMDFEELEDVCDDKDLETDPDDYDEEDVEKLRKAIAKELGINLPKAKKSKKNKK